MIKLALLLFGIEIPDNPIYEDMCKKNISHLTARQQVEYNIGCSRINNKRIYRNHELERVYEQNR